MIIYIHGFGSSALGAKATLMKEYFKRVNEDFLVPSLSYVPDLAITTLEDLIESYEDVKLVGSSLGGFYATYLAHKYNLKTTLINPAITPCETLQKSLGYVRNYYDNSVFEWNTAQLESLQKYSVKNINPDNFMVLLQKGDETLDYKEAEKKFIDAKLVIEEQGSHSFDGIERYFEAIREF